MQSCFSFLALFCILLLESVGYASERKPQIDGPNNSGIAGIHAMGNGRLCVYGQEANILQAFGPPYSAPGMFEMVLADDLDVVSDRIPKSAVWTHKLIHKTDGKRDVATVHRDFVTSQHHSYIRTAQTNSEVNYHIRIKLEDRYHPFGEKITVKQCPADQLPEGVNKLFNIIIAPGVPFYSTYKSPRGYHYQLLVTGAATLEFIDAEHKDIRLTFDEGEGKLMLIAGTTAEEAAQLTQKILNSPTEQLYKETLQDWEKFASAQVDVPQGPLNRRQHSDLVQAADDISVLIKSQQADEGGVLAGIIYHTGYVRDQYGVSRALLALGHNQEAKRVLNFYYGVWKKFGFIKNAQSMGYDGLFHIHENDDVEITGFLVMQAFDYYQKTGDIEFLREILPMLQWATEMQQKHIIDGMLPFNGDETYIAGGVVPRKVMYHGSAESTLLFIEGSEQLLKFVKTHGLWDTDKITALEQDVISCKANYRVNFFRDGKLYINNPVREAKEKFPATRAGVCLFPGHLDYFTETYHYKGSLYFCADCMKKDHSQVEMPTEEYFQIPSANLFPIYINAHLFTPEEKERMMQEVIDLYLETGRLSSLNRILGYDYGMFLYALAETNHPLAGEVYAKMMGLRDGAGAWLEYYIDEKPSGCGCRPWESGINIEAALRYANTHK